MTPKVWCQNIKKKALGICVHGVDHPLNQVVLDRLAADPDDTVRSALARLKYILPEESSIFLVLAADAAFTNAGGGAGVDQKIEKLASLAADTTRLAVDLSEVADDFAPRPGDFALTDELRDRMLHRLVAELRDAASLFEHRRQEFEQAKAVGTASQKRDAMLELARTISKSILAHPHHAGRKRHRPKEVEAIAWLASVATGRYDKATETANLKSIREALRIRADRVRKKPKKLGVLRRAK